ncbi:MULTISPECIES: hypothetical protein [Nocardiopsis]|uniref:Uncharacterized protein n=1 Tax=Nocardiopsis tropica TaxID=109330 RepID=A0ABU7KQS9_9ACTN|nr:MULTISPECIES: hypothetical protein [Nocardiopsis]MCK9873046.1 hypothetical protein [Nocardiopsis dassonvillei]MEE2051643.1 hypothetical protein [Nocardiopsis umidischolae]
MVTFRFEGFTDTPHTLTVEQLEYTPWDGQRWRYALYCGETLIFSGDDIRGPAYATENEAARHLMGFLTLRPGDTDDEYFADYTPEQRLWCEKNAEYLASVLYGEDGEEIADLSAYRAD